MQISFLVLCLTAHIIGEFYLRDDELDNSKISGILLNLLFYSIPFWAIFAFFEKSIQLFKVVMLILITNFIVHIFIEWWKKGFICESDKINKIIKHIKEIAAYIHNWYLQFKKNHTEKSKTKLWFIYLIEQIMYIALILLILFVFKENKFYPVSFINGIFIKVGISKSVFIKWIFIVICMYKPVNTTFKIFFADSKPIMKAENDDNNSIEETINTNDANNVMRNSHIHKDNNGAIIGFLERIIIIILISVNQYSAIGFILTAKSVARYNKISQDAKFGEYYLIGTLYSTLFAIVLYHIIF